MSDTQTADIQTALFANDTFYAAFAGRDPDAMAAVWAETAPVTCLHPGWPLLSGREDVLQSWHAILTAPTAPPIECRAAEAFIDGASARIICYEVIGDTALIATNLFTRESGRWKLVHHQSGPAPEIPPAQAAPVAS